MTEKKKHTSLVFVLGINIDMQPSAHWKFYDDEYIFLSIELSSLK